ncbi:hypothetical protein QP671_12400, partial [Klebsiella pneumoniae]
SFITSAIWWQTAGLANRYDPSPTAASASASGWALALVGVLLVGLLRELRRFQRPEIVNES